MHVVIIKLHLIKVFSYYHFSKKEKKLQIQNNVLTNGMYLHNLKYFKYKF